MPFLNICMSSFLGTYGFIRLIASSYAKQLTNHPRSKPTALI